MIGSDRSASHGISLSEHYRASRANILGKIFLILPTSGLYEMIALVFQLIRLDKSFLRNNWYQRQTDSDPILSIKQS
jgi:hypothetical protein